MQQPQLEKWNLPPAIHQRIAHSHSSLLLPFIPWGEVKRNNYPPASPTRMWASSLPPRLCPPLSWGIHFFPLLPPFLQKVPGDPQFSPEYTLASCPCPHTLAQSAVQQWPGPAVSNLWDSMAHRLRETLSGPRKWGLPGCLGMKWKGSLNPLVCRPQHPPHFHSLKLRPRLAFISKHSPLHSQWPRALRSGPIATSGASLTPWFWA